MNERKIHPIKLKESKPKVRCLKSLTEEEIIDWFNPDNIIQIVKDKETYDVFYKTDNYKVIFEKWKRDCFFTKTNDGIIDIKSCFYKCDLEEGTNYFLDTLNSCELYNAKILEPGIIKINQIV